ncbi:MAG TPA: uroporphyrinogen-III synthase [Gemmatimonadales bacterium]|jgi:uroporphyrinogen-III synthase|nr:uroporphyrinogen-III synthase [Gemmatimonadales bacterium]
MSIPRLVITLSRGTLDGLDQSLGKLGADWVHLPLLEFEEPDGGQALVAAVARLGSYGSVAITSRHAASLFAAAVARAGIRPPAVWVTGPGSVTELRRFTPLHCVESPAPDGSAAELARMMLQAGVRGPVLFPCGERHRTELPRALRAAGVLVDELACYRAVVAGAAALRHAAASGDVLVAGSGAVVEALAGAVTPGQRPLLVTLGPITAAAAQAAGWSPAAVSLEPTVPSLLQALHGVLNVFPVSHRT